MMGVSVKSITDKLPADAVTGCILLGRGFFGGACGSAPVPISSLSGGTISVLINLWCSCPVTCFCWNAKSKREAGGGATNIHKQYLSH